MPRIHPTIKLGVYGQYDLNPEKSVTLYTKSRLQNKLYIKTPNWDVARLNFELKGIQSNREYENVTQEQNRMRFHSYDQLRSNEKRLTNAKILLSKLWEDFVEVNDFLKDCEAKENESFETMDNEKKKQSLHKEEIGKLDSDLSTLQRFINEYHKTVDKYRVFEDALVQTIQASNVFGSINDLTKRCDSLQSLHTCTRRLPQMGKVHCCNQKLYGI